MSVYAVWLPEYESYARFGSYGKITLFKDASHASLFCSFLQAKRRVERLLQDDHQISRKVLTGLRGVLHEFNLVKR